MNLATSMNYLAYSKSPRTNGLRSVGMTLIEVVTGLAILGTILAAVVLAKAKHTRQLARADRQLEAVTATDQMLSAWWLTPDTIPRSGSGRLPGLPNLSWKTRVTENIPLGNTTADVVRLEVRDERSTDSQPTLITLDLILPEPDDDEE